MYSRYFLSNVDRRYSRAANVMVWSIVKRSSVIGRRPASPAKYGFQAAKVPFDWKKEFIREDTHSQTGTLNNVCDSSSGRVSLLTLQYNWRSLASFIL